MEGRGSMSTETAVRAESDGAQTSVELERREDPTPFGGPSVPGFIKVAFGLTAPPVVGLVILGLLWTGVGPDAILESEPATSTALLVSALLMLAPAAIYARSPDAYAAQQMDMEKRFLAMTRELLTQGQSRPAAGASGAGARPPDASEQ
jgi:hypothetical protein